MKERNKKHKRRLSGIILGLTFTALILTVSTFAWFIGTRTVNVSSFDVKIASTESLLLSLDGENWDTTVSISKDTLDDVSYNGHTNWWAGKGLSPVSSIGQIDDAASRLMMYEKASLTPTPGGYRLMASRVPNTTGPEVDGYVAFDLFIKNFTGSQYIEELDILDEEAIYLSVDSEVTVSASGVANTGIENSVRVAFAQIGRVVATTTTAATITGITCEDVDGVVTGICTRPATIWEPNDIHHTDDAISWYETSCKRRTGANITLDASYNSTACGTVTNGVAVPTYAVNSAIAATDNVDVYDGAAFNGYTASAKLTASTSFDNFTDTMKEKTGVERPEFMKLAPNSITKVRVYIYLEGQDIDNYDFASIGRSISVQFGFTKERFTDEVFGYTGPSVRPAITLLGDNPMTIAIGSDFDDLDEGATATDVTDGNLTSSIVRTGSVNTATAGTYTVTYRVTNSLGYTTTATRSVIVE